MGLHALAKELRGHAVAVFVATGNDVDGTAPLLIEAANELDDAANKIEQQETEIERMARAARDLWPDGFDASGLPRGAFASTAVGSLDVRAARELDRLARQALQPTTDEASE